MNDQGSDLEALYLRQSKHSSYQLLHPLVANLVGASLEMPSGKLERERQKYFEQALPLRGARVLDIGANTGYFAFAALAAGARAVVCFEGNPDHAEFLKVAATQAGLTERLTVHAHYFDFLSSAVDEFDVVYCLNVLHHLGDDFGDAALDIATAREQMLVSLNRLANHARWLALQIGFNWKGDRRFPLFAGGEKEALIDFVVRGISGHWRVEHIIVADPQTGEYGQVSAATLPRDDTIGEFRNRPLFILSSERVSR